jgi:flagellar FliL protein
MARPTPKASGTDAVGAKSRTKIWMMLGVIALLLGGGGGAGAWYLTRSGPGHQDPDKAETPRPPLFLALDPFTVNLQEESGEQYLQVGLTLKVDDQGQIDLLKLHMPEVRSRLLMLLSSKKGSEILTPEGKRRLSDEIIAQVKQPLTLNGPPQGVSAVFFTSFVIQ